MKKKTVIFFCGDGDTYGAGKMFTWVANALLMKYEVMFCAINDLNGLSKCLDEKCEVINLHCNGDRNGINKNPVSILKTLKEVKKVIKKTNPIAVISFGDFSFYFLFLVHIFYHFNLIVSERVDPYTSRARTDKIRRMLFNYSDGAVFQTEEAKKYYGKKLQSKAIVINNPVKTNAKEFWTYDRAEKSIVYVGRIDNFQKRLDLLLKAFKIVLNTNEDYELNIYGTGLKKEITMLKDLAASLNISEKVHFKGRTNDVLKTLLSNRVLVLSSDFEGIPNILIEGMTVGIPIVSTDCSPGGARLLLEEGKNGILVPRGDADSLASGIDQLINNPVLCRRYGESSIKSLSRFDEKQVAETWLKYINRYDS